MLPLSSDWGADCAQDKPGSDAQTSKHMRKQKIAQGDIRRNEQWWSQFTQPTPTLIYCGLKPERCKTRATGCLTFDGFQHEEKFTRK